MLRAVRIEKELLSPASLDYAQKSEAWQQELYQSLGKNAYFLATARVDETHVSYYTDKEGGLNELMAGSADFEKQALRLKVIEDYLSSGAKLKNSELETSRAALLNLIRNPLHLYKAGQDSLLLIPYHTKDEAANLLKAIPPSAVTAAGATSHLCLWAFLSALLALFAFLLFLYFTCLKPWPFEGDFKVQANRCLACVGINPVFHEDQTAAFDALRAENQAKQDELLGRIDEAVSQRDEARVEADDLKEQLLAEQKQKEELEAELLKLKEAQEQAKLEAQKEEQRLKELDAALKKAQQQQVKAKAEPKAKADPKTAAPGKKPKCKQLQEQGQMPKMVIGFDGSQSMLEQDVRTGFFKNSSRLSVATQSANRMIDAIDQKVSIGLVEINGCNLAKNHGFFGGGVQRLGLKSRISGINPNRYDGMTPLVSGLTQMAQMVDGVNADAVGILISDGEDTCVGPRDMDICQVASSIHQQKPKLKIHAILIGSGADRAACVANITGGKVFKPKDADQINSFLQQAGAEYRTVCED